MRRARWLLALTAQCLSLLARADGFDAVREKIVDSMAEQNIPSVVVGVAQAGTILWEEGFGWANVARRIPATPRTVYALASLSKPMTATAMMVQVERGKLDLDRPINDYLGEQKLIAHVGDARGATLRRIANHTSGLPVHYQFFYADEAPTLPSVQQSIARYGHLTRPPGERYEYSNFGYGLLGEVIERSSGQTYQRFMAEAVFEPLGMAATNVKVTPDSADRVAMRYAQNGTEVPFYDFDHRGASAVYSSSHDVLRFAMFHLKNHLADQARIISDASIDAMQVASAQNRSTGGGVGLGWHLREDYGTNVVSHAGDMAGVSTRMALLPKQNIAIVLLTNVSYVDLRPIEADIVRALLPQPAPSQRDTWDVGLNGRWRGVIQTYAGSTAVELDISPRDGVRIRVGSQAPAVVSNFAVDATGALQLRQVSGSVATADAGRYPYRLEFDLQRRGDVLNGSASAVSRPLPDRDGNALSYWVELQRQSERDTAR